MRRGVVSRGLGPVQEELLAILGAAHVCISVGDLPELLGVGERFSRTVVASMVDRELVEVVNDAELGRRAWLPRQRMRYPRDREWFKAMLTGCSIPRGRPAQRAAIPVKQALSAPPWVQRIR